MKTLLITYIVVLSLVVLIPQAFAIGSPPPERVPVSILRVMDIHGNSIDLVNTGEQIQIQADLANAQDTVQSLAYIVEVYDEDDNQVFRGWIEATLEPMDSFSPAVSWIPEKPGYYTTKMMVWEALDNPSALSPDLDSEFYVVGNMNALNENRSCNEGKELVFKINYKKVACVFPETLVKLLGRGWTNWHDWYSPLLIDNLRQGPQDVDEVHAEFVKREVMKDSDVAKHFMRAKNYDYTCCTYQYNENDYPLSYQLVINFSDLPNEKQLVVVYDLRQTKVVDTALKDMVQLGGPIITEPEPPFEKEEPFTKIEIMFGEQLNDKLVPVTFTEVTTHAETLDEITVWNFELIGHSGADRRVVWDTLPKDKRIGYEITDDNGQDIRMPETNVIPADLHLYEMDCGFFQIIEGESAHPSSFPIKNNTSIVLAKNSWMGIYPDSNGEYSFEFASIFEHYVRLPEDIGVIISHETKECDAMWQIDGKPQMEHDTGYYTKMSFRLE